MNKIKITVCITCLLFHLCTKAQVTIGAGIEPRKGTLLDLKENDHSGKEANSSKGLGLPRVALFSANKLTIDTDDKVKDYAGSTVYNVTNNEELAEGMYCWTGTGWKRLVFADGEGVKGSFLTSDGKDAFHWSVVSDPKMTFHRPTQTASFDESKAIPKVYSYNGMGGAGGDRTPFKPSSDLFKNGFVYSDKVRIESGKGTLKYLLLDFSIDIDKATKSNAAVVAEFQERVKVQVYVGDQEVKTFERAYTTPAGGLANTIVRQFSIVQLTEFAQGDYDFKIKVSITSNTYSLNKSSTGTSEGRFLTDNFLTIKANDIGFVLYEEN